METKYRSIAEKKQTDKARYSIERKQKMNNGIAVGGYWIDVCRNGLFEGSKAVRLDKIHEEIPEALKKYKVVKGLDGVKYVASNQEPYYRKVSESEAYDILCGESDMSFAKWGGYW